ncbi:hypothetical protein [Natronospira bacteriovora]|uniref:Uncharacterized protein n=1 Tax=Natronospira bacteriovora TaxID=3069753 RepID=A0ABU0W5P5_9GAMM|nr:hypothetical protein [Natronospira sp. AB-CW4]MDQ2069088.1 hypothetical protein [Natronospira sp. AB-CW4]
MPISEQFPVSGAWWIDIAVLIVVAMLLLFLARNTAHEILIGASRAIAAWLRVATRALQLWSRQLDRGARRATLILVADHQARLASREITALRAEVDRLLKHFPDISDALSEDIRQIERDYQEAPEMPPPPSTWGELVERVSSIEQGADPALKETLASIRTSIERVGKELAHEHGRQAQEANQTLTRLRPRWSRIERHLETLGDGLERLSGRLNRSDRSIRRFETVQNQRRSLTARLRSWLALHLFVGATLAGITVLVALVNYHLAASPLQEVVGSTATIGPFAAAALIAVVLVLAQLAMATLVADSAGLTRMIASISRLGSRARQGLLLVSSLLLVMLAASEASLALLRDSIHLEAEWLARELEDGISRGSPELRWVPSLAQMIMGFVLPLTFVVLIPAVESFFQTARIVLLLSGSWLAGMLTIVFRLLARLVSSTGHLLAYVYDLLIVIPLSLERRFRRREPSLGGGEE